MNTKYRLLLTALMICLPLAAPRGRAAEPESKTSSGAAGAASAEEVAALTATIDRLVARRWEADHVEPAAAAGDAQFLRRVWLDIAGTIPPASRVRSFLADESPDKRRKLVDELLAGPGYPTHFATVWQSVLMPEGKADRTADYLGTQLATWLRQRIAAGAGYDAIVREILTAPLDRESPQQAAGVTAFFQAKQAQPDELAASTARIFLGVRIQCAQCHVHPTDRWKREDFWQFAAFFAGLQQERRFGPIREVFDRRELAIPDSTQVVQAAFLDGTQPRWKYRVGARETLADWLVSGENPYFARATANRLWHHLFGRGLVEPVDDFRADNPPSHAELLDELARQLVEHQFDVTLLIRAITASRAYQLSSVQSHASQSNPAVFARFVPRRLSATQLVDSLSQATGLPQRTGLALGNYYRDDAGRGELVEAFNQADAGEFSTLQALALMNGRLVAEAARPDSGRTLTAIIDYPRMTTAQRIEALYLTTLSRPPSKEELTETIRYVDEGGPRGDWREALGDVFWALLNSSEFMLNH